MTNPSVCLICLVDGRHDLVPKAVAAWRAQTYRCELLIYDTGDKPYSGERDGTAYVHWPTRGRRTIGELRNEANAIPACDILAHYDSDDWSHPKRIEEQVALLQRSGADAVGYNEMLFWKPVHESESHEAWIYTRASNTRDTYCIGTSLMYWRRVWARHPFQHLPPVGSWQGAGEDHVWLHTPGAVRAVGVTSFPNGDAPEYSPKPRLIARVSDRLAAGGFGPPEWRRVPEWNSYCAEVLK